MMARREINYLLRANFADARALAREYWPRIDGWRQVHVAVPGPKDNWVGLAARKGNKQTEPLVLVHGLRGPRLAEPFRSVRMELGLKATLELLYVALLGLMTDDAVELNRQVYRQVYAPAADWHRWRITSAQAVAPIAPADQAHKAVVLCWYSGIETTGPKFKAHYFARVQGHWGRAVTLKSATRIASRHAAGILYPGGRMQLT